MEWHELLIFLAALWGVGWVLSLKKGKHPSQETLFDHQGWSIWTGIRVLTGLLIALFLVSALGLLLRQSTVIFVSILLEFFIFSSIFLFPQIGIYQPYRAFGLTLNHLGPRLVFGMRWIVGYLLIGQGLFLLLLFLKSLQRQQDLLLNQANEESFIEFLVFKNEWGIWSLWLPILFIVIFRPVFEEILFRGLLYGPMRQKVGPLVASFLTSFLFALIHGADYIRLFVLGMILVYLYERTQSLIPSILFHVAVNLIDVIFYFKGDVPTSISELKMEVGQTFLVLVIFFIIIEITYRRMKKNGCFERSFNEYAYK
jgi:membrane protease YdiL (CAAX protease family)